MMMPLTDTHFHFCDHVSMEDYVRNAETAGVDRLILNTGSLAEGEKAAEVSGKFPGMFFAAGIYPQEITSEETEKEIPLFRKFAGDPKFAAVGEIGLDLYYDYSPEEFQIRVFSGLLDFALDLNKPVIIHCRDKEGSDRAYQIVYDLLRPFAAKGGRFDLHCYAGTAAWAEKFLALGGYFGTGGILTFKHAGNIRDVIRVIPMERLLLETDAPYLTPVPYRGKPNESKYIPVIAEALATLKGTTLEQCAEITSGNARKLFGAWKQV